jgi:hypothetical protein
MSFLVKICGITRPEDAQQAVAAGADLIGLNFWRGSKRFVQDEQAREIVAAIPEGVLRVGVFVNAHPLVVSETVDELKLDRVQLHGDEIPATWNWLRPEQIIRTIRVRDEASLKEALGWEASLFLYDAYAEGYGGSGKTSAVDGRGRGCTAAVLDRGRPESQQRGRSDPGHSAGRCGCVVRGRVGPWYQGRAQAARLHQECPRRRAQAEVTTLSSDSPGPAPRAARSPSRPPGSPPSRAGRSGFRRRG